MTGVYVSFKENDLKTYRVRLDADGGKRCAPSWAAGRTVFRAARRRRHPNALPAAAPRRSRGSGRAGGGRPLPPPLPELTPPPAGVRQNDWNLLSVTMDGDIIRPILNQSYDFIPGATEDRNEYGPIALYVGGSGEVRFKDVSFKELHLRQITPEQTSTRFRMQRLDEFYYAWGAAAGDFNNDGVLDIVAGPNYYLGPTYRTRGEIDLAPSQAPSTSFARTMVDYAYDFTGDGWTDVLAGESRPMHLYVNPKGQNRRWAKHSVLPQITASLRSCAMSTATARRDHFGTGGVGGVLAFGWPDRQIRRVLVERTRSQRKGRLTATVSVLAT